MPGTSDTLDIQSRLSQRSRQLCGDFRLLPRNCTLDHRIEIEASPIAEGGFSSIFRGRYRGDEVAIKRIKVTRDVLENTEAVRGLQYHLLLANNLQIKTSNRNSAKKLSPIDTYITQISSRLLVSYINRIVSV